MNLKSTLRIFNTLKYLRRKQIKYQLFYRLKAIYYKKPVLVEKDIVKLANWESFIFNKNSYCNGEFSFLNINHKFEDSINWNLSTNGKLWVYNLNYFEFLNSKECSLKDGYDLIRDYCTQRDNLKDGLEPYPISLRVINWIKFLSFHQINDPLVNGVIVNDIKILGSHLEFHILANHLLENIFALYMASVFLSDKVLNKKSIKLLKGQLQEQILDDGAHFEQSPMYHQIILYRLLDLIHFNVINVIPNDEMIIKTTRNMLSWLEQISFANGEIPYVNDAAPGIAPTTQELLDYAEKLGLKYEKLPLSDSGYRKVIRNNYEMIVDIANIASNYQPGHLHADTLQFIMNTDNKSLFVDTGVTTYDKNQLRNNQRSTSAHNTVVVRGENSYDVWGGFRVGRRSKLTVLKDTKNEIIASLNLYFGAIHNRTYQFSDKKIVIIDSVENNPMENNTANFHLDFSRTIKKGIVKNTLLIDKDICLSFENAISIDIEKYYQSIGFNKTKEASKIVVTFANQLKTIIDI